jgi:Lon protease-like protein
MSEKNLIPLFPLNVVLLPDIPLPLHIFEERYKELINASLTSNSEFGIVYLAASKIQPIGCTAHIEKIIHMYDDGRLDIRTRGVRRFKIQEISENKAYLQARVEFFDDIVDEPKKNLKELADEGLLLLKALQDINQNKDFVEIGEQIDYKTLSFQFGAVYGFTPEEKQNFLELRSTAIRMEETVLGLRDVVQRVRMMKEIEKANQNGKKKYRFSIN